MLARIASARSPRSRITALPVSKSVATARNGVGRRSKLATLPYGSVKRRRVSSSFWPWIRPFGNRNSPCFKPIGRRTRKLRSSCLRRNARSRRGGRSRNASCQSTVRTVDSICAAVSPLAYRPPTIAPMLVPAMQSIGTLSCASTFRTPMCASPRAPPPDRTRQIRGRAAAAAPRCGALAASGSAACAPPASSAHAHQLIAANFPMLGSDSRAPR